LFETKNKRSGFLDEVIAGRQISIAYHGKAVACLVPVGPGFERAEARQAAKALREACKGVMLSGVSLKMRSNEGRP
jgi:antitoxin (DNA-binding transcriptional repressor) of toxin-antitoxin stability system